MILTVLPFITDILTAINIILIFGSAFLVLEIVTGVGSKGGFILTKGLWLFLPAVVTIAAIRIYDFFLKSTPLSAFFRELLYLVFTALLFTGLLVQFLSIRRSTEKRM